MLSTEMAEGEGERERGGASEEAAAAGAREGEDVAEGWGYAVDWVWEEKPERAEAE